MYVIVISIKKMIGGMMIEVISIKRMVGGMMIEQSIKFLTRGIEGRIENQQTNYKPGN